MAGKKHRRKEIIVGILLSLPSFILIFLSLFLIHEDEIMQKWLFNCCRVTVVLFYGVFLFCMLYLIFSLLFKGFKYVFNISIKKPQ